MENHHDVAQATVRQVGPATKNLDARLTGRTSP
jgi:hypothetical protein